MKKKNIIKKLLSVVLSAATVFSLLTLPAHAIVPGEDSYTGQEDGYIRVNFENKTTEFIPKSDIPVFTGKSTYDVLNPFEKTQMEIANAQITAKYAQTTIIDTVDPNTIDDGSYDFVDPTVSEYTGVVFIGIFDDNDNLSSFGSGFMVDSDTVITALHTIYPMNTQTYEIYPSSNIGDVRVYFQLNHAIGNSNYTWSQINSHLHTINSYIPVSMGYFSSVVQTDTKDTSYDWFIGKLESEAPAGTYFFDCVTVKNSKHVNYNAYSIGYPKEYTLRMAESYGYIKEVGTKGLNNMSISNRNSLGMSGGPVNTLINNTLKCCGIIRAELTYPSGVIDTAAIYFYSDLMDAIVSAMNQ